MRNTIDPDSVVFSSLHRFFNFRDKKQISQRSKNKKQHISGKKILSPLVKRENISMYIACFLSTKLKVIFKPISKIKCI